MKIDVHDAEVKTATVEVRTLTISRRQVTLNVFRQLLEEDVIDIDTGQFRGVPWGTVNYCPPKECKSNGHTTHLHVVWQCGNELRRNRVDERGRWGTPWPESGTAWLSVAALTDPDWASNLNLRHSGSGFMPLLFDKGREQFEVEVYGGRPYGSNPLYKYLAACREKRDGPPKAAKRIEWDAEHNPHLLERTRQQEAKARTQEQERVAMTGALLTEDVEKRGLADRSRSELLAQVKQEVADEWKRRDNITARWEELCALPQLFIAT
jgi:hypothetical protein